MASKKYPILITLILAVIALARFYYWSLPSTKNTPSDTSNESSEINHNAVLPVTENEIATSSPPFIIKGEIIRGNPAKKQIIFTFDAGSGLNSLNKILEVTQAHGVKPTFFVTGLFAEKYSDAVAKMATAGAEVFNHTYDHPYLTKANDEQIAEELNKADQILSGLTGTTTKPYFRPPYGDRSAHVLDVAQAAGFQSVYWTLDALDWEASSTPDFVKNRIETHLKNGSIILMHIGDDITGQILDEIFTYIESQEYKIVGLTKGLK